MSKLSIKIAESEINKDDPWADDKLGRKACADTLTSLLAGQTTALTVSVNGEWGSGKTFMLKRWQQQLANEKYKAIYFNAWEDDFMGDPLVSIVGQLRKCLKEDANLKGLAKGGVQSVWTLASGFTKKITGMDFEEAALKSHKAAASKRDNILDDYDKLCKSRAELKTSLKKMAKEIFEKTQKPLVFIVDELDRCRPTFAIETLERIKHLFDIDHVVFVLGIDRKQLGKSIKSIYGNIDIENYLHRFIDLDFQLPAPDRLRFFNEIWDRHEISFFIGGLPVTKASVSLKEGSHLFKEGTKELLKHHDFSLREIQQFLKIYALVLRSEKGFKDAIFPLLVICLIILKIRKKDLYKRYCSLKCSHTEVMDAILPEYFGEPTMMCYLASVIHASFSKDPEKSLIESIEASIRGQLQGVQISNASKFVKGLTVDNKGMLFLEALEKCKLSVHYSSLRQVIQLIDFASLETQ
jgi:hypothetical protein